MLDYTLRGVPVSKIPTQDILDCLKDGIEILQSDGLTDAEATKRVIERLNIEIVIRSNGMRG